MVELNGEFNGLLNAGDEGKGRVHEWEAGLPNVDDITPLSHGLVTQKLLLAFNIKLDPCRTEGDVIRASKDTISTIRGRSSGSNFKPFDGAYDDIAEEDGGGEPDDDGDNSGSKKSRRNDSPEDADSAVAEEEEEAKTLKRPRLVWTSQLHRRFVDVVSHLGIKSAVPKTIMQLMNVEGLTRENVASHLQKYRLYLKRMQGVSIDGGAPSNSSAASSEQMFGTALPPMIGNSSENGSGSVSVPIPMSYGGSPMVPMPVPMMGIGHGHGHGHMSMGMGMGMAMTNYNHHQQNNHSHQ